MYVGSANPRWRGKRSRHSLRMCKTQSYVSGKRPMTTPWLNPCCWNGLRQTCKRVCHSIELLVFVALMYEWILEKCNMKSSMWKQFHLGVKLRRLICMKQSSIKAHEKYKSENLIWTVHTLWRGPQTPRVHTAPRSESDQNLKCTEATPRWETCLVTTWNK